MAMLSVSLHRPNKATVESHNGTYWAAIEVEAMDFCVFVKTPEKAQAIADAINMEDNPDA